MKQMKQTNHHIADGAIGTWVAVAAAVAFIAIMAFGGCDWFEPQPEANLPPETVLITECGQLGEIDEGADVRFTWSASDVDGVVAGFEWSYDDTAWVSTTDDFTVVEAVTPGEHRFQVRARDDEGEADPTPAECNFTALAKGVLVERMVLVELFTTNICQNCDKAEAALDSMLAEIGAGRLAVVAYHDMTESDGLASDETVARIDWYTKNPGIPGDEWPIAIFDGLRTVERAPTVAQARADYRVEITRRIEAGSPIRLTTEGELETSGGNVAVGVKVTGRLTSDPLVLRFAVIEDDVRYNGWYADIFDFVTRDLLADDSLTVAAIGDSVGVERAFAVDETWNAANMDVVAFVQDTVTREVIQSARLRRH
ncbi:MAG: hypothetical protein V1694_07390 [Candidatus Eisenbacteria bacterium]